VQEDEMDLFLALESRRSVRHFTAEPVPADALRRMAEAALLAPSVNAAPLVDVVAVQRPELIAAMADAVRAAVAQLDVREPTVRKTVEHFSTFFAQAPALLAFTLRPYQALIDQGLGEDTSAEQINRLRGQPDLLSVGAAEKNTLLAATALGYGSCWLSGPLVARDALESLLGIAAPQRLATLVAVGKQASAPKPRAAVELAGRYRVLG